MDGSARHVKLGFATCARGKCRNGWRTRADRRVLSCIDRGREMAGEDKEDLKSAGGDGGQAPEPEVKKTVKKKVGKKTAKKTTKKKTVAKKAAKKKVVKKAQAAPATAAASMQTAPMLEPAPEPPKLGPVPAPTPETPPPASQAPTQKKETVSENHAQVQTHLHEMEEQKRGETTMTNDAHSSESAATHSFWPKVIIAIVIVIFGFVYIRGAAKQGGDSVGHQVQAPAAAKEQVASSVAAEGKSAAATAAEPQVPAETKDSDQAAPVAGMASIDAQPAVEPHVPSTPVAATGVETTVVESSAPSPAPVVIPEVAEEAQAAAPAAVAPTQAKGPADVRAPAQAAAEPPAPTPVQVAPVPAQAAPAPAQTSSVQPAGPGPQPMPAKTHQQLMEEYQAMRKAAEEEWRRMWGGRQQYQPANPYYGNPYYRN